MIDWDEIATGYSSVRDLIKTFYEEMQNLDRVADKIGVSTPTLRKKMKELGLSWGAKQSRQENMKAKILEIPPAKLAEMTAEDIRKYAGYAHVTAVHAVLRTNNRRYKPGRSEDSREKLFYAIPRKKLESMTLSEICQKCGIAKATAFRFCSQRNILYEGSRMRRKGRF
jgi:predicted DNA-binding transcriptional regulator AlpA